MAENMINMSYTEQNKLAEILRNCIAYKHGPASALEWIQGTLIALQKAGYKVEKCPTGT